MKIKAPTCPRCQGRGSFSDEVRCTVCRGVGKADHIPTLRPHERALLTQIGTSGDYGFTNRDWSFAMILREAGLIAPASHPVWGRVPIVRSYTKRMAITWLGAAALARTASPVSSKTEGE